MPAPAPALALAAPPVSATLFAYQVGFGDCFLLRFTYEDKTRRHILIDFGTTGLTVKSPKDQMLRIAADIADKCSERNDDKLNVVVATHRHADHISGFATNKGKGSGDVIASLKPERVLQPWTEAPDAPVDSLGPDPKRGKQAFSSRRSALKQMHKTAALAVETIDSGKIKMSPALAGELRFIGEDNLSNKSAVNNLMSMGKNVYVFHGCDPGLGAILPGIEVTVLGPPTLHQTDTIRKQRSRDVDEFWQLAPRRFAEAGGGGGAAPLFPDAPTFDLKIAEARWVADRIDKAQGDMMLGLVRALDAQMNNTSVILLFKAGTKKLLFPGDAQLENWRYALQSDLAPLLDDVDLYKVGHHGSLNATPKSMWNRFAKRGAKDKPGRLTSVMSTRDGKHGSTDSGTEVPRSKLIKELSSQSTLVDTRTLPEDALYSVVEIDLR